jgi:hypothetical protein
MVDDILGESTSECIRVLQFDCSPLKEASPFARLCQLHVSLLKHPTYVCIYHCKYQPCAQVLDFHDLPMGTMTPMIYLQLSFPGLC